MAMLNPKFALRNRKIAIAIGMALIIAAITVTSPAWLKVIGQFLVVSDEPMKSGAIVVLSGSVPDRVLEAAELYKDGFSDRIILLRGMLSPAHKYVEEQLGLDLPDNGEINALVLKKLGVPDEKITIVREDAESTEMEARVVKRLLNSIGIKRILLVTSKSHTRRAKMIFRSVLGEDVEVRAIPSRYDDFEPLKWWKRRKDVRQVIFEYQKMLAFFITRLAQR